MKKLVRVSTDLQVTIHDYPEGSYQMQNKALRKLIGKDCDLYESVSPKRLYSKVKVSKKMEKEGHRMVMLVALRTLIQPKNYPPIDQALYDTSLIRQDIEQVTGLQDAMRQSVVKPKTATEAQIMQQGLSARVAAFRDGVEDWLQEIATYSAQILLRELKEEDVARIMGEPTQTVDPMTGVTIIQKPYDWPQLTTEEVARLIKVKIAAGSTGAPNKLEEQENWQKLLPTVQTLVQMIYQLKAQGLDTGPVEVLLRETVHRFDDHFDADQLIPNI